LKSLNMHKSRPCVRIAALAIFALAFVIASNRSEAATVTLKCNAPSEMTLVYEGDQSGTLTVTDSSGVFSLPARMETREGDVDGTPTKATGILANGPVSTMMPDKAAIEACVKSKLSGDLLADSDVVFTTALGCSTSAPMGKEPVQVNAKVEISVTEPPDAYVFVTRTYVEPSSLAGGKIELSSMPPPKCALAGQ
jgi:hypothetical protein